jgi:CRISPR-associated protein (TIGR02584 family)
MSTLGLSPQTITETIYALACKDLDQFIVTDVIILTTTTGEEELRSTVLAGGKNSKWAKLFKLLEYPEPKLKIVVPLNNSEKLTDINTPDTNIAFANALLCECKQIVEEKDTVISVSLAGGRKTMSFYAGYVLSLIGREDDLLCRVLVPPELEANENFYFPEAAPVGSTSNLINLIEVPFVRLRNLTNKEIEIPSDFSLLIAILNELEFGMIKIFCSRQVIKIGDVEVKLQPLELLIYLHFVLALQNGKPELDGPIGRRDLKWGAALVATHNKLNQLGYKINIRDKTLMTLKNGIEPAYFRSWLSKINRKLRRELGVAGCPVEVYSVNRSPSYYQLKVRPNSIEIFK